MSTNKRMGDKHEDFMHQLLGGRKTRGSGNQWQNPADGRHSRYETLYAFAWDGKSTLGKSVSITRSMLSKIKEQASPEIPMIGVRFYNPEAGERALKVDEDWVLVPLDTFAEILERLNHYDSQGT